MEIKLKRGWKFETQCSKNCYLIGFGWMTQKKYGYSMFHVNLLIFRMAIFKE